MEAGAKIGRRKLTAPVAGDHEFGFVPEALRTQCHKLVVSFHEMHGYACLPDMLWKAGLAGLIDRHKALRNALQKASTARSARRANEFFVIIAAESLALEVLARDYGNWSGAAPAARAKALEVLEAGTSAARTWLIEHYFYPPRYDSPGARITPSSFASGSDTTISLPPADHAAAGEGAMLSASLAWVALD